MTAREGRGALARPARRSSSRAVHAADETLAASICADHLRLIGLPARVRWTESAAGALPMIMSDRASGGQCLIGALPTGRAPETIAQASSGLMAIHGRGRGKPLRLGLAVASVAAGVLASQGMLGIEIGLRRGLKHVYAETGLLQGALQFLHHHLAIATCGDVFPYDAQGVIGTPFPTADGDWVEVEALSGADWIAFWNHLGLHDPQTVGGAWLPFVYRYLAGQCLLPAKLHETTSRHGVADIRRAAAASGVAVSPVRTVPRRLGTRSPWRITLHAVAARPPSLPVAARAGPLTGLRVLDLGTRLQGPLAALLLRAMGAEVIKVEPPRGDFGRGSPPFAGNIGAAHLAYNRGKRVIELDYKSRTGRAEILELAETSDVLLHNWPLGRAEMLGLDSADLARSNPSIIYAHASGWGDAPDPPSSIAGDFIVQAHAGCAAEMNSPDEPPSPSGATVVDVMGGLLACEAVLAGLFLRERDGRGRRVETSLMTAALQLQNAPRCGWGPLDRPVETMDGYLMISAPDRGTRDRLARVLGSGSQSDDVVVEQLAGGRASEWESQLHKARIPACVACEHLAELPSSPMMRDHLEKVEGVCWAPAAPWLFHEDH